jgi:hypothetical protein
MAGQWRVPLRVGRTNDVTSAFAALLLVLTMNGCVPIPYRPSASVAHEPVTAEESAAITLSTNRNQRMIEYLSKSIQHDVPRVVLVDGTSYLYGPIGSRDTLAGVLAPHETSPAAPVADYLLAVGTPIHRRLHDTGFAAPFPYFPLIWVGYEKIQSRESLSASLVELPVDPQVPPAADSLHVSSTYSEFIAALVYGVATVAMPQTAVRSALARDVAHTLAAAHPTGTIRLVVVAQEGGTAEPNSVGDGRPPRQVVVDARGAIP